MSSSLRRAAEKVGGGIAVVLALLVGLIAFAPSAFAHHSNADATYTCAPGGGYNVTWESTSWSPGNNNGTHPAIQIATTLNGSSVAANDDSEFPKQLTSPGVWAAVNNLGRFTLTDTDIDRDGALFVPYTGSDQTFAVTSTPLSTAPFALYGPDGGDAGTDPDLIANAGASLFWGGTSTQGGSTSDSVTLPKNDCKPPAAPGGGAQVLCPSGTIRFSLTNTGGQAITLDLFVDGVNRGNDVNVPAGTTAANPVIVDVAAATVGLDENETLPWQIKRQDGSVLASGNVTRNCQQDAQPKATATVVCVEGQPFIRVTLENETAAGGESVTFQTSSAGSPAFTTRNDTIAAGGADVIINVPVTENAARTVVVSASGLVPNPTLFTFTGNCFSNPQPRASASGECVTNTPGGTYTLTLKNENTVPGEPVTFTVTRTGSAATEHTLTAGATLAIDFVVAENATITLTVAAAGLPQNETSFSRTFDCVQPSPALATTTECATFEGVQGIVINLVNNGFEAATVVVGGGNVVVPAKVGTTAGTASKFIAVAEGGAYNVAVTFNGVALTGSPVQGTRDCQHPAPTGTHECVAGGIRVSFTNTGETTSVTVGEVTKSIANGETVTFFIPVVEGAAYDVTPTSPGNVLADIEGTRDCEHPTLLLTDECATNDAGVPGIQVTLTNDGPGILAISIFINDGEPEVTQLPAKVGGVNGTLVRFIPLAEGDGLSLRVTSQGNPDLTVGVEERNCVEPDEPTAEIVCAEGQGSITLSNGPESEQDAVFTVTVMHGDDEVEVDGLDEDGTVTVGPDDSVILTFPVDENESYVVNVSEAQEGAFEAINLDADCFNADAEVTFECAEGDVVVTFTNDGEESADFTITVTGDGEEKVFTDVDTSEPFVYTPTEGSTVTVTVTADDDDFETSEEIDVDCVHPEAEATFTCVSGDIVVALTNPTETEEGGQPATFVVTITKQGGATTASAPIVVQPNGTGSYTFDAEENATYNVVVTEATEEAPVLTQSFVVNCNIDGLSLSSGGICDGDAPFVSWTITLDSPLPASGVTVEFLDANGVVRQTVPNQALTGRLLWPGAVVNSAGDPVDWPGWLFVNGQWVQGDDGFLWARPTLQVRFQINPTMGPVTMTYPDPSPTCVTAPPVQVAGVQVTPAPAPLPTTGSNSTPWLVLAGALLMLSGTGLFGTARLLGLRRRR